MTLYLRSIRQPERQIILSQTPIRIGRGSGNQLVLTDRSVSRQHAIIKFEVGQLFVEDLNSTSGTHVNGVRVQRSPLRPGDVIAFGTAQWQVGGKMPSVARRRPGRGRTVAVVLGVGGFLTLMLVVGALGAIIMVNRRSPAGGAAPSPTLPPEAGPAAPEPQPQPPTPVAAAPPAGASAALPAEASVVFAADRLEDGSPAGIAAQLPAGIADIWAFVAYANVRTEQPYTIWWAKEGALWREETGAWVFGESGQAAFRLGGGDPLLPGAYSFTLWLGGDPLAHASVEVVRTLGQPGALLYADSFDGVQPPWLTIPTDDTTAITYTDGALQFALGRGNHVAWSLPGLDFTNVDLAASATTLDGPAANSFGLLCRVQDANNFYMFLAAADGNFGVLRSVNGETVVLAPPGGQLTKSSSILRGPNTNRLRAVCAGNELQFFINDEQAALVTDDTFATGDIGVFVGSFQVGGVVVQFDDVTVRWPELVP